MTRIPIIDNAHIRYFGSNTDLLIAYQTMFKQDFKRYYTFPCSLNIDAEFWVDTKFWTDLNY